MLRPGNAAANDAADHAVIDDALAQIPDGHRHGTPIFIRADSAGGTREFLAICVACVTSGGLACRSRSGSGSPTPSRTRSDSCPSRRGRLRSTPPGTPAGG